jgi:hypothetical protein
VHHHGDIIMLLQLFALTRIGVGVEDKTVVAVALQPVITVCNMLMLTTAH